MFEYINVKTGARLSSPDIISGENWEVYEGVKEVKEEVTEEKEEPKKVEEEKDNGDITKKEIMAELDALGIDYNPKARKDELYKLMMGE